MVINFVNSLKRNKFLQICEKTKRAMKKRTSHKKGFLRQAKDNYNFIMQSLLTCRRKTIQL